MLLSHLPQVTHYLGRDLRVTVQAGKSPSDACSYCRRGGNVPCSLSANERGGS